MHEKRVASTDESRYVSGERVGLHTLGPHQTGFNGMLNERTRMHAHVLNACTACHRLARRYRSSPIDRDVCSRH